MMAPDRRAREKGSALLVAVIVIVLLTVVGLSLVLVAETDLRIAENEREAVQALCLAEAAAGQVKRWFDHPRSTAYNLAFPSPDLIDRSLRKIDTDGPGPLAPILADGSAERPYYKQGIDPNGDGVDEVFDRPYRGSLADELVGTEDGPDMRIDADASSAANAFLSSLTDSLLPSPPEGARSHGQIARIDVFAPPILPSDIGWTRHGVASVRVVAKVYEESEDGRRVVAQGSVKLVLNEIPYRLVFGPLHSCGDLEWSGAPTVHWGAMTAAGTAALPTAHELVAASLARDVPIVPRFDRLRYEGVADEAIFLAYKGKIETQDGGLAIEDPWFRLLSEGTIANAPTCGGGAAGSIQPCPFDWDGSSDLGAFQLPHHPGGAEGSHSNIAQGAGLGSCPQLDYALWKRIATSGGGDVHYFTWVDGSTFREGAYGVPRTFRDLTNGRTGLFFFDTQDQKPPHDDDGDGTFDNLTPDTRITGGAWGTRGIVYLNSASFGIDGAAGGVVTFAAPGEPFRDANRNGRFDAGESYINLAYPSSLEGVFRGSATDAFGGSVQWNPAGPPIAGAASVWGILYNQGSFDLAGDAAFLGSVATGSRANAPGPGEGTVHLYWDGRLAGDWPPQDWDLPRVHATAWMAGP